MRQISGAAASARHVAAIGAVRISAIGRLIHGSE
jgi:hypothetical protein